MSLRANPLSPGRASPFRRPESPSSTPNSNTPQQQQQQQQQSQRPTTPTTYQSTRPTTPTTYQSTRPATPSRLQNSSIPNHADGTWSPSTSNLRSSVGLREPPLSPSRGTNGGGNNNNTSSVSGMGHHRMLSSTTLGTTNGLGHDSASSPSTNTVRNLASSMNAANGTSPSSPTTTSFLASSGASPLASHHHTSHTTPTAATSTSALNSSDLSRLPAAQVRELREAFEILDRDGDGHVDRADISDMLAQVGLPNDAASVAAFFPTSSPHATQMTLSAFLSGIAGSLARMSPPQELLAALSAFDDDDSGQIDVAELADALMHAPSGTATGGTGSRGGGGSGQLSRRDVDAVMADFVGRRAFSKYSAASALGGGAGGGEVFRYREWVAGLGPVATTGNAADKAQTA